MTKPDVTKAQEIVAEAGRRLALQEPSDAALSIVRGMLYEALRLLGATG